MNDDSLWNKYEWWLLHDKLGLNNEAILPYVRLWDALHNKPFVYQNVWDENRAEDGKYIRDFFDKEVGNDQDEACVLEVLVAFSCRMDNEYVGASGDPHPGIVFMDMIGSLGLLDYPDDKYNDSAVESILDCWMTRSKCNVKNGEVPMLFKLAEGDAFKMPLWNQMNYAVDELYKY